MPNLVETSTNLASVRIQENDSFLIITSQRSSVESAKFDIAHQVESAFTLAQAEVTHGEGYPGWKPNLNSEIFAESQSLLQKYYWRRTESSRYSCRTRMRPFSEKISLSGYDFHYGPQMYGVHSPNERLSISSTRKCWQWPLKILEKS